MNQVNKEPNKNNAFTTSYQLGYNAEMDILEEMERAFPNGHDPLVSLTKDEINDLPLYAYEGPTTLVTTPGEQEEALHRLQDSTVIGFDTETKPSFRKGTSYKPSLIQIATHHEVFLFHLKSLPLSEDLTKIFESVHITKTGVAISDDMRTLASLNAFTPKKLVDLGKAAKHHNIAHQGLRSLAALLLGIRISKNEQCSNWGRKVLTDKQIRYAATDAWISLALYLRMEKLKLSINDKPILKKKTTKREAAKKQTKSHRGNAQKISSHKTMRKPPAVAHFSKNDQAF